MSAQKATAGSWLVKLLVAAAFITGAALVGWGLLAGRESVAVEEEHEGAIKVPVRVSEKNGDPVITLDTETRQRSGIETGVLPSMLHSDEVRAYGMVLDVARLTELNNNYANAKAQVQTAQAKLAMSKPAFDRAQKLFNDTHVSRRLRCRPQRRPSARIRPAWVAAEAQVRTLTATAYQEWGAVLGKSLVDESPMIKALIERQNFLLQITLPPGVILSSAACHGFDKGRQRSGSRSPSSRQQRASTREFRASASSTQRPAASGVLPGMNVLAFLPSGKSHRGRRRAGVRGCMVAGPSLDLSAHVVHHFHAR